MREIITQLESLRRRSRFLLLAHSLSLLVACAGGAAIALIVIDFLLRLPPALRLILLLGGLGSLALLAMRLLVPAVRFAPSLTDLALRTERLIPAVAGRLASSVEFALAGIDRGNDLAARSVRETERRLSGERFRRLIDARRTLQATATAALVLALGGGMALASPAAAMTGLQRLLLPYGSAQWPARTGVESLMGEVVSAVPGSFAVDVAGEQVSSPAPDRLRARDSVSRADGLLGVHPRGQALPLRARVTRGENDQRVDANYRLLVDGRWQRWQHAVLTQQGSGPVHERLIDPRADAIELYFATHDARTETERVRIVPPPAVRRATLLVQPPEYARENLPVTETELGTGLDGRSAMESAPLVGSNVWLDLHLNKALPGPDETHFADWLRRTLDWGEGALPAFEVDRDDPRIWSLQWTLDRSRTLVLDLVDEFGLGSIDTITYSLPAVEDRPPTVTIITPESDQTVLATARIDVAAEAQDDVAVSRLALEARQQRRGEEEAQREPVWREQHDRGTGLQPDATAPRSAASASMSAALDLAPLHLREGDIVHITAVAEDSFDLDGRRHPPVVSSARRLRIISEMELAASLRRQLGVLRQNAIRIEALQAELQEELLERGIGADSPGLDHAQGQISERIAGQRDAVTELTGRAQTNRLDDGPLDSLLQQSRELLDFAGRASGRAVEEVARGTEAEAIAAQQEVRDELADLISLLDRDEDTWVTIRELQRLLEAQQALGAETSRLAEETLGQSIGDLTPEQRTELDRIAQQQRDLRDRSREMMDNLRHRAQSMEQIDPQSAGAMRRAATLAEQQELDRDMQAAADRARQNQLRGAAESQQAAGQTVQQMLDEIEFVERARAQELQRRLASLVQSIERLVNVQENELIALAQASEAADFAGRDRGMIRLAQNTRSVAGEAREAGQEARRIARTLDRAADAQGLAVAAFRDRPVRDDEAQSAGERSLELLNEALEMAREAEQQAAEEEIARRREDLTAAYRELAERQVALREQTLDLAGLEDLTRRQIVEARRQGAAQDAIAQDLDDLSRATREVADSLVFTHVHRRIGSWSAEVSRRLWDAQPDPLRGATDRQQLIAESIGRLIEALEEVPQPPDEFEGADEAGGGEGGGTPALIPPLAELRLLHSLQEQLYHQTRTVSEQTDLAGERRADRLRGLGAEQRELMELSETLLQQLQQSPPAPQ